MRICNRSIFTFVAVAVVCMYMASCNQDLQTIKPAGCSNCGTGPTAIANLFNGEWKVTEKGSATLVAQNFSTEIISEFNTVNSTEIFELNAADSIYQVLGTVSGDSLIIPKQSFNEYTVQGVGQIIISSSGSMIILKYEAVNDNTGKVDDYGYIAGDGSSPAVLHKQ